jgi:glutathione S-transferase
MRPWVLLKQAGIAFDEVRVRFDSFDAQSEFKRTIGAVSPTAKVPVLVDGDLVVWDTLAIAEYVAETWPDRQLWPADAKARARARSVCAEMHSGFTALRSHCPMNIEALLPDTGALIWRDQPGVRADVQRLVEMWGALLQEHGGPMLFGQFTVADAYFAPVRGGLHAAGVGQPWRGGLGGRCIGRAGLPRLRGTVSAGALRARSRHHTPPGWYGRTSRNHLRAFRP